MAPIYRERPVGRAGAVVWQRGGGAEREGVILPDGCLDLIWTGGELLVAGPDRAARRHSGGGVYTGLRLPAGLGPALLGAPAHELCDAVVPLHAVWGDARARSLAERVAEDPVAALGTLAGGVTADPFGTHVLAASDAGVPVATLAAALGVTTRTLHRRCLPVFGYGPQYLGRILRLQRALAAVDAGTGWADAASAAGYADQPHLAREVRALSGTTPTGLQALRAREHFSGL